MQKLNERVSQIGRIILSNWMTIIPKVKFIYDIDPVSYLDG